MKEVTSHQSVGQRVNVPQDLATIAFSELGKAKSPAGLLWLLFGLCVLISLPGPIGLFVLAGCAFGIASFWLWQRRLTVRRVMKLGSTASPFTKIYLPVVLTSGWKSLIGVAVLPAALAYTIAPDYKAPAAAAAPVFFWMVSYIVSLFSPIFTLQKAALTAYARQSDGSPTPKQKSFAPPKEIPVWVTTAALACAWAVPVLVVLTVLLRVTGAGEYRNAITIFGEFIGFAVSIGVVALIPAALAAGVSTFFKLPFAKAFRPAYALVAFLISLFFFGATGIARIVKVSSEAADKSRMESLRATVGQVEEALDASQKAMHAAQQPSASGSDMEKIGQMIKHASSLQVKLVEEYSQALSRDGLEVLLDPDRVYQDKDFSKSMAIADKLHDHIKHYEAREQKTMFEDLPNYAKTLGLSAVAEKEVIDGYKRGLEKALPQQKEVWELEKHIVDQFIAAIAHLKATRDRWKPQDGYFTFERDSDLKRFDEIMARVDAAVARQEEIRKAALATSRERLEQLKKLTGD
jgi:hypothetical protein